MKDAASGDDIVNVGLVRKRVPVLQPFEALFHRAEGALNVFSDLTKLSVHHSHGMIRVIIDTSNEAGPSQTPTVASDAAAEQFLHARSNCENPRHRSEPAVLPPQRGNSIVRFHNCFVIPGAQMPPETLLGCCDDCHISLGTRSTDTLPFQRTEASIHLDICPNPCGRSRLSQCNQRNRSGNMTSALRPVQGRFQAGRQIRL